jgi:hypothetical protein
MSCQCVKLQALPCITCIIEDSKGTQLMCVFHVYITKCSYQAFASMCRTKRSTNDPLYLRDDQYFPFVVKKSSEYYLLFHLSRRAAHRLCGLRSRSNTRSFSSPLLNRLSDGLHQPQPKVHVVRRSLWSRFRKFSKISQLLRNFLFEHGDFCAVFHDGADGLLS